MGKDPGSTSTILAPSRTSSSILKKLARTKKSTWPTWPTGATLPPRHAKGPSSSSGKKGPKDRPLSLCAEHQPFTYPWCRLAALIDEARQEKGGKGLLPELPAMTSCQAKAMVKLSNDDIEKRICKIPNPGPKFT